MPTLDTRQLPTLIIQLFASSLDINTFHTFHTCYPTLCDIHTFHTRSQHFFLSLLLGARTIMRGCNRRPRAPDPPHITLSLSLLRCARSVRAVYCSRAHQIMQQWSSVGIHSRRNCLFNIILHSHSTPALAKQTTATITMHVSIQLCFTIILFNLLVRKKPSKRTVSIQDFT